MCTYCLRIKTFCLHVIVKSEKTTQVKLQKYLLWCTFFPKYCISCLFTLKLVLYLNPNFEAPSTHDGGKFQKRFPPNYYFS